MLKKLWQVWGERKRFISLLVGVPSYEVYVEHMKKHHPEEEVVCQKQFLLRHKQDLMQRVEKYHAVVNEKGRVSLFILLFHVEQQNKQNLWELKVFRIQ